MFSLPGGKYCSYCYHLYEYAHILPLNIPDDDRIQSSGI